MRVNEYLIFIGESYYYKENYTIGKQYKIHHIGQDNSGNGYFSVINDKGDEDHWLITTTMFNDIKKVRKDKLLKIKQLSENIDLNFTI